jgi:hypothetical protein
MLDYQTKGCSKYGAQMGRASDLPFDATGELLIRVVPIDTGGYDPGGAYWGSGQTLFYVFDADGRGRYLRAVSVDEVRGQFPGATFGSQTEVTDADVEDMFEAYVECALWLSVDDEDKPLDDRFSSGALDDGARDRMRADCARFATENAVTLLSAMQKRGVDWSQVGHDLWLTRNGHGCGFWDGDWPKPEADVLTEAAERMGDASLFVDEETGKVHDS